jgi:hypothetical protein
MSIPEERLMAYADGELDGAEHASERTQIEAAMKADPAVARRVEQHRAMRARFSNAFADVLAEPVPDRLLAAARSAPTASDAAAPVTDLARVRAARAEAATQSAQKRARWSATQWGAIAASLVFGAVIGHFALQSPELGPIAQRDGRLVAQATLDQALSNQLASEQPESAPVHIGLTFKTKSGEYCRTFVMQPGASEKSALGGLACREGNAWDVRTLARVDVSAGAEGGYHPVATDLPASVRAAVEDQIDGEPLDAPGVAQAKTKGWR